MRVAVLDSLQHGVPAAIDQIDVCAAIKQHFNVFVIIVLAASDRFDDGEVFAGGIGVGAGFVGEEADYFPFCVRGGRW